MNRPLVEFILIAESISPKYVAFVSQLAPLAMQLVAQSGIMKKGGLVSR